MSDNEIRIDQLRIRLRAGSAKEGHVYGQEVLNRVSKRLPLQKRTRKLGAIDLRVDMPKETVADLMSDRIAEAILKALA